MEFEITTIRLTKNQKRELKAIADFNKTNIAEIIRAFADLFMADSNLQTRVLEAIKRNVVYDTTTR
jgi:hypothetical protein